MFGHFTTLCMKGLNQGVDKLIMYFSFGNKDDGSRKKFVIKINLKKKIHQKITYKKSFKIIRYCTFFTFDTIILWSFGKEDKSRFYNYWTVEIESEDMAWWNIISYGLKPYRVVVKEQLLFLDVVTGIT